MGREDVLAFGATCLDAAAAGRGHVLLLAGDAGIGKSRVLTALSARAADHGFVEVRGHAFPGDVDTAGAVLLALASSLRRSPVESAARAGATIASLLRTAATDDGDVHRHRRLLVQDLSDALTGVDLDRPLLLVVEDLHWSDELSLEVLARSAATLHERQALVLGTYRMGDGSAGPALRAWRERLVATPVAYEARLQPLTPSECARLVDLLLGTAAPARLVTAVHDRTDGIPLHVEELLAAAGPVLDTAADPGAALADLRLPPTMTEAVLARVRVLEDVTRAVASAAAVIGRSFDVDLLAEVTETAPSTLQRSLAELERHGLVLPGTDGATHDFRHALIRDAVYGDVPVDERRTLHERVARGALERGYPPAVVASHFDRAGVRGPAHTFALLAAQDAARRSAHREAFGLYRTALRNRPVDTDDDGAHAGLLTELAAEAAAADDNAAAAQAYAQAHALRQRAGEALAAALVVAPWVAALHLCGTPLDRRVELVRSALASVEDTPDADSVRADLLDALAAAYMLDRRLDDALVCGREALALHERRGLDTPTDVRTAITVGSVLVFAGDGSGWRVLEDAIARALRRGLEADAARGYRMVGSCASVLVEYDRGEDWLERGIAYAERVDLWNHRSYMAAHLAHVRWAVGRWDEAEAVASHALADGRGGITTEITARYVLGYLALGRGEHAAATDLLQESFARGEAMSELQRFAPPLWGLAELALATDQPEVAVARCERGYSASMEVSDSAYLFPFLVTGVRAYLRHGGPDAAADWCGRVVDALTNRSIPGTLAAVDHARGLLHAARGEPMAAAESLHRAWEAWRGRRRWWEGTWAAVDLAQVVAGTGDRRRAEALGRQVVASAHEVGAGPLAEIGTALLTWIGESRGRRRWHPLSEREHSVAALIAEGMTNREIAEALVVAPKTVSAHVEHILTKLGARSRAEIAAWVARADP